MSQLDPTQTIIRLPDDIPWEVPNDAPPNAVERAVLSGSENEEGQYMVLMKWYPGFASGPHFYRTDRLCVVVSGVWWCNSGEDFDPASTVPVPAGSFVKRVAGTPHYDGVPANAPEPAIIAISGIGPTNGTFIDTSHPWVRRFD